MAKAKERVWDGAQLLEAYTVPIDTLTAHSKNARQGDVMALVASLERWGQIRAVLVDSDMTIVAGHHIVYAAKELGWTHIAVIPHDFPDEASRDAYLVADNFLSSMGGYDEQMQMSLVDELEQADNLSGTGLTLDTIEDMRSAFEVPTIEPAARKWESAESPEAQAARAEALQQQQSKKQVVMLLLQDVYDQFMVDVGVLAKTYGTTGSATDTITHAVHAAAEAERAK